MRKALYVITLLVILSIAGAIYYFYYNVYDQGQREGILYNFSRKGNVFKTYEGILLQPGLRPNKTGGLNTNELHFSVSDEKIADSLMQNLGKQITIHYIKYRKSLPWRGENYNTDNKENGQYLIDGVIHIKEADNRSDYNY